MQVVVESVESVSQYWHTSAAPLEHLHPNSDNHEINLSVIRSAFVVGMHRASLDSREDCMRGGSVIQLFHKVCRRSKRHVNIYTANQEISAYLAAEGNFINGVSLETHLRVRLPDSSRPSRLLPPTSAVSV